MSRAQSELELLMKNSWPNSIVPHITFDDRFLKEYFPGPEVWGHSSSSTISHPPVWAIALEYLIEKGADKNWAKSLILYIEKSHRFFAKHRDPKGINLVSIAHPWESGLDNCVAWDKPLQNVSTKICNELKRIDNKKITDSSQRPSDNEYKK